MAGITMQAGEGNVLNVLGMPLWFLCDAEDTEGAWSLMEEEIPVGLGPPPHRHDWDEAYYVVEGALDFEIDGKPVRVESDGFTYLPRNTVHAFKGASPTLTRVLIFAVPAHSSAFFKDVNREVRTHASGPSRDLIPSQRDVTAHRIATRRRRSSVGARQLQHLGRYHFHVGHISTP